MMSSGFLAEHPHLHALLADGDLHDVQAQIDSSFTEVTFRLPHAQNVFGPLSIDHLTSRLQQNIANTVQHYEPNAWYNLAILAKHEAIDTDAEMQRSPRLDQPNIGAQPVATLRNSEMLPSHVSRRIKHMGAAMHAVDEARTTQSIAAQIASTFVMPNGERIPRARIKALVCLGIQECEGAQIPVRHFQAESLAATHRQLLDEQRRAGSLLAPHLPTSVQARERDLARFLLGSFPPRSLQGVGPYLDRLFHWARNENSEAR